MSQEYKYLNALHKGDDDDDDECREITVNQTHKPWNDRIPKSVETSPDGKVATSWKQQVQTATTVTNKKTGVTVRDNE